MQNLVTLGNRAGAYRLRILFLYLGWLQFKYAELYTFYQALILL